MLKLFIMDKRSVIIDDNYSDDSYDDSESQELCVESEIDLKQSLNVYNNSERSENNRKLKGLLSSKNVKSKTFTIDNILGIENDQSRSESPSDSKMEKNSSYFGKPIPISPTALRQICRLFFIYFFFWSRKKIVNKHYLVNN